MMFMKTTAGIFKRPYIIAAVVTAAVIYTLFCFSDTGKAFWEDSKKFLGLTNFSDYADGYDINIHVIDVGKADAILIENRGTYVLVDGGVFHSSGKINEYLKTRGIETLDAVIASHPDSDHIGGLPEVINKFGSRLFCSVGFDEEITYAERLLKNAVSGTPFKELNAGDEFSIGEMKFSVMAPVNRYDDTNDNSLVIKIMYKEFSMLFTGDMAENELADLLNSGADLNSDILKVSHHGSKTGTNEALLLRVSPEISVISVGPNTSNLPSEETVKTAQNHSAVLRTDEMGNILISSNGDGNYKVYTEMPQSADK